MIPEAANNEAKQKLNQFKQLKGRKGICADYDETLVSSKNAPDISSTDAITLMIQVAESGLVPLIATARGVTMERIFTEVGRKERKTGNSGLIVYIAGADGRSLAKFIDGKKVETLYEFALRDDQIQEAIVAYKAVQALIGVPDSVSVKTFQGFLNEKWDQTLLSRKYLDFAEPFNGNIFIEPTKFSIAGPDDKEKFLDVLEVINIKVQQVGLRASWGGRDRFIHVRPAFEEDGKLKALRAVAEKEVIPLDRFATFGDAPLGNDKGILTEVPYAFTNATDYLPHHQKGIQPYVLEHKKSQVHAVHDAIKFLTKNNILQYS